ESIRLSRGENAIEQFDLIQREFPVRAADCPSAADQQIVRAVDASRNRECLRRFIYTIDMESDGSRGAIYSDGNEIPRIESDHVDTLTRLQDAIADAQLDTIIGDPYRIAKSGVGRGLIELIHNRLPTVGTDLDRINPAVRTEVTGSEVERGRIWRASADSESIEITSACHFA